MIERLLEPRVLPLLVTAVVSMALALWLSLLDISNRANRNFAAVLLLTGLSTLLAVLVNAASSVDYGNLYADRAFFLAALVPYAHIGFAFFLIAFLSTFPRKRGALGATTWGPWLLMGLAAAATVWYLLDHAAYAGRMTWESDITRGSIGRVRLEDYGPLGLFLGLRRPLFALAALLLARDYAKDPSGSGGFSTFLLFSGFAVNAVFDAVTFTVDSSELIARQGAAWFQSGDWVGRGLPALTLPITIGALAYMARAMRYEKGDETLQEARRFMLYVLPVLCMAGFTSSYDPWQPGLADVRPFLIGTVRLVVPLLLAYALLRYSLFSLDIQIKAGVRRGILLGLFVGVFFLVSEAAEAIVASHVAPVIGVVSAGLLAVVGKPIQRLGERAADGVMPDTKPVHKLGSQERFAMYRDHFSLVQQDGTVSDKERRMLGRLAAALEMSENEAADVEAGRMPKRDEPPPALDKASTSRVLRVTLSIVGTGLVFGIVSAVLESLFDASSFAVGLVCAAAVALLLEPIEALASRLTKRRKLSPRQEAAMRDALVEAWADGELSDRDKAYLSALQKRLRITRGERRRIERGVRQKGNASG